jgi:exodeoxyribonuclease VII large subunit
VPVISAIGHETDFTIADFVADLRAPTPSAAAEMVLPTRASVEERMEGAARRLLQMMRYRLERNARRLHALGVERAGGLLTRKVNRALQRMDEVVFRIRENWRALLTQRRQRLDQLESAIRQKDVRLRLAAGKRRLDAVEAALAQLVERMIAARRARAATAEAHLSQLSPLKILERGYAIVETSAGTLVKSPADAPPGTDLGIRVAEGRIAARVVASLAESNSKEASSAQESAAGSPAKRRAASRRKNLPRA